METTNTTQREYSITVSFCVKEDVHIKSIVTNDSDTILEPSETAKIAIERLRESNFDEEKLLQLVDNYTHQDWCNNFYLAKLSDNITKGKIMPENAIDGEMYNFFGTFMHFIDDNGTIVYRIVEKLCTEPNAREFWNYICKSREDYAQYLKSQIAHNESCDDFPRLSIGGGTQNIDDLLDGL